MKRLRNMLTSTHLLDKDEIKRRRALTEKYVKATIWIAVASLIVEIIYYYYHTTAQTAYLTELRLLIPTTFAGIGVLLLTLGLSRGGKISHLVPAILLVATFLLLALFSDSPEQVMNGRSTVFFMVPILLAGVLIHSYATFIVAAIVIISFAAYASLTSFSYFNPLIVLFFVLFSSFVTSLMRSLEKSAYDLKREVAHSRTILGALRGAHLLVDTGNKILRWSDASDRVFNGVNQGVDLKDIFNDPGLKISADDREKLSSLLDRKTEDANVKIAGRDFAVIRVDVENRTEQLISLRDITTELENTRLKDTALAMVSHELRTPLAAIHGHAELIARNPVVATPNAVRIMMNTARLLAMVENLLDQARLRAGTFKVTLSETMVATSIRIVHSMLKREAEEKGISFVTVVDPKMKRKIVFDQHLLQRILTNLANNAIKFTEKGTVMIKAEMSGDDHWCLSVTDTGVGIPKDQLTEVFKEFYQVQPSKTSIFNRENQGTGIGLSITKDIVFQLGGTLSVESEVGEGSTFTATFPLRLPKRKNKV